MSMTKRVTTRTLQKMRDRNEKITMVTAYDATFARLFDEAGVDSMLVGDSMGNVIQGHQSTIPVTLEHIIYHTSCVTRGAKRAHIVADMPFMSYGASIEQAIQNAGRLMKEGGAHAVKFEGGKHFAELVYRMTTIGIPVMGHLGFTPQSVHSFGGHFVQGRGDAAQKLIDDAKILQDAGAYAIVFELIPADVAKRATEALTIPTIGIGAGPNTSGQVLVCNDFLGMDEQFTPKFLKKYANLSQTIREATSTYIEEVKQGAFPTEKHSFE